MLKRYLLTFCNQGLVSVFNFALTISLVRQWEVYDFGIFALVLQIALTLEGFQNALVATPLSVWAPALARRAPRRWMETTLWSVGSLLMILTTVGAAIVTALIVDVPGEGWGSAQGWLLIAAVSGFLLARLIRHFGRAYLFARLAPGQVAIADLTYVVVGCGALAAVWLVPDTTNLPIVLAVLAAGSVLGTGLSMATAGVRLLPAWRRRVLSYYAAPWKQARWGLIGVTTTTLHTRSHAGVVTAMFGPELFAVLAAGEALVGPIRTGLQAWGMITRPTMAAAFGRDDQGEIDRINRISLVVLGAGLAAFIVLLVVVWGPLSAAIYGDKYADMSLIVGLWALIIGLFAVRSVMSITLQAMRAFRELAFATGYGAVVSLVSVTILAGLAGFEYSLLGLAMGETVVLASTLRCYLRLRRAAPKIGSGTAEPATAESALNTPQ